MAQPGEAVANEEAVQRLLEQAVVLGKTKEDCDHENALHDAVLKTRKDVADEVTRGDTAEHAWNKDRVEQHG